MVIANLGGQQGRVLSGLLVVEKYQILLGVRMGVAFGISTYRYFFESAIKEIRQQGCCVRIHRLLWCVRLLAPVG